MLIVRLATLNDAESIAGLTSRIQQMHQAALPETFKAPSDALFPKERLKALLQDPTALIAVAEADGSIVGHVFCSVVCRPESAFTYERTCMYLQQIGVEENARQQGIGTALIDFVRKKAAAAAVATIELDCYAFNAGARQFFEKAGFSAMQIRMRRRVDRS